MQGLETATWNRGGGPSDSSVTLNLKEMTKIRILQPGDEAALEAFLRPRIDSSIFLMSNLRRADLEDRGEHFEGTGRLRGRRIGAEDLDLVTEWRLAYSLEALNAEDTEELRASCREDMESSLSRRDTWVLEDDGDRVASSSFNASLPETVQVGGVWTPLAKRGRGYGRAVVAASLLDARAEGVERGVLFSEDTNVFAVRAYEALGFRRIGAYSLVLLRESLRTSRVG